MNEKPAIVRHPLLSAVLDAEPTVARVEVARIELQPLQVTGLHRHPCDVVGLVTAGSIRFQLEGEEARLLGPGDAFHEPKGARIAHFDNASEDEDASFVAFYLLGVGETELIEML
jgi:quercetin dioxygenase-like cupin family protein